MEEPLRERVAKLEERTEMFMKMLNDLNHELNDVKAQIKDLNEKLWYLLAGVITSILLQILLKIIP
jgi:uncharacterized coiled-coil protein SlyX